MKKKFIIQMLLRALMLFTASVLQAQKGKMPAFKFTQSNNKVIKAEDLPKNKPILLIYFSPECDHCETVMKEFFKQPAKFASASVAMVTFLPMPKLLDFEKKFPTKKYANVYSGSEGGTFFIKDYYKLDEIPFVALYDKNRNLVKSYLRNVPLDEISAKLKTLK